MEGSGGVRAVGRPGVYGREGRLRMRSFGSGMREEVVEGGFVRDTPNVLLFLCSAVAWHSISSMIGLQYTALPPPLSVSLPFCY